MKPITILYFMLILQIFSLQWCEENEIIKCYEDNSVTTCKQTFFEGSGKTLYMKQLRNVTKPDELIFECNLTDTLNLIGRKNNQTLKFEKNENGKMMVKLSNKKSNLKGIGFSDCDYCDGGQDA